MQCLLRTFLAVASLSHLWKHVGSALQLCEGAVRTRQVRRRHGESLHLRQAGGPSAGPGYPLAVQL